MATLKKILEAARLIETVGPPQAPEASAGGDDDIDAIIRRAAEAERRGGRAAPPPLPGDDAGSGDGVGGAGVGGAGAARHAAAPPRKPEEALAFAQNSARQQVADAGFPVERLLKLVEGLRTLDPTTRRAAITAMDVADETWSMEHVLADADAKVEALRAHQREQQGVADALIADNSRRVQSLETERDGRVADLRGQIAALEAQIQDAIGTAAAEVAKLNAESESNKAALHREIQRIDAHILNLADLAAQFRGPG